MELLRNCDGITCVRTTGTVQHLTGQRTRPTMRRTEGCCVTVDVATIEAAADNHVANELPIGREIKRAGAATLPAAAFFYHPCLATRLGGVSGGKEIQGWRDSSQTATVGAGKFGSAKLPMATATYPGKLSPSQ
jgi:hypothetical protein